MAPPVSPPGDALAIAVEHHRAGRIDAAERIYRALLDASPDHADANHNLGLVLLAQGDPGGATAHFMRALENDPEHAPYWLSLVEGLLACNDPAQALAVIDRGIECGLDTPAAHALRSRAAQALARAGRAAGAGNA